MVVKIITQKQSASLLRKKAETKRIFGEEKKTVAVVDVVRQVRRPCDAINEDLFFVAEMRFVSALFFKNALCFLFPHSVILIRNFLT